MARNFQLPSNRATSNRANAPEPPHGSPHDLGCISPSGEGHKGILEAGPCHLQVAEGDAAVYEGPDGGIGVERVEGDTGAPNDNIGDALQSIE